MYFSLQPRVSSGACTAEQEMGFLPSLNWYCNKAKRETARSLVLLSLFLISHIFTLDWGGHKLYLIWRYGAALLEVTVHYFTKNVQQI